MNYITYFLQGGDIKYIEGTNIPSTGDAEKDAKLLQAYILQAQDLPLSGTDPVGQFVVEGAVLGKPFELAGKAIMSGITKLAARLGLNRARAKIISATIDEAVDEGVKTTSKQASKVVAAELAANTGKTSYAFFERPNTLSEAEVAGVPKGERDQVILKGARDFDRDLIRIKNKDGELVPLRTDLEHPILNENVGKGLIYYVDGKPYKNAIKGLYVVDGDPFYGRPLVQRLEHTYTTPGEEKFILYADKPEGLKDFSSVLTNYAKTLPEEVTVDSQFADTDFINYFINYYKNLGYDISNVDPKDLTRIINENYKQLTAGLTGRLQGRVFWNGSPNRYIYNPESGEFTLVKQGFPEQFTKADLPLYASTSPTENVGTYFGTLPFLLYASPSVRNQASGMGFSVKDLPDVVKGYDMLPYLINRVNTIYNSELPEGLRRVIPKNTAVYSNRFKGNNSRNYNFGYTDEIGVGLDSSVKGLFPHPEAFLINPDGTIQLIRDWNNPNLHYKQGGALNYLSFMKEGSSIHIKPENKGKFTETKKRTGKTTEELTHSKNPLTRKRAIFAQNAAKWNHKK